MIKYYLQNKSYYDGNIMNWWAKGRNGYTANLDNAHQFTAEELAEMSLRPTDVAWLCSYIDGKTSRCVNASYCNFDEMKERENIILNQFNNNGWISIFDVDNPPPKNEFVLVTDGFDVTTSRIETFFEDGEWITAFENPDITHWQYLPKPPQE